MKTNTLKISICVLCITTLLMGGCSKEEGGTATLMFKVSNPFAIKSKSGTQLPAIPYANPDLTGDVTQTTMTSLRICVGDVWISQDEIKVGSPDNLNWIKITGPTNQELKLFEDYTFVPVEIPAGTYKSIKMTFKNRFYRIVNLVSNPSVKYELLETMGSTFDPCDHNDENWIQPNYLSTSGNHSIVGGVFQIVQGGEKVAGFTLPSGGTVTLTWRLGAGATEVCTNNLLDLNKNRKWDCGTDDIQINCPPSVKYMWDFVAN